MAKQLRIETEARDNGKFFAIGFVDGDVCEIVEHDSPRAAVRALRSFTPVFKHARVAPHSHRAPYGL
jgi:hypothetical protein